MLPVTLKVSVWPDSSAGPALMAVAHGLTVCAPASSNTVWSAPLVKLGASFTGVAVMMKFCTAEVSTPPLVVPPSSCTRRLRLAVPLMFGAVVKVSTPVGDTAGATENIAGLSFAVMVKVRVCADSLAGPALMPVAHGLIVCAPMSLTMVTVGPAVNAGTSLTGVSVIDTVAGSELTMLSLATKVKLSAPNSLAFGV